MRQAPSLRARAAVQLAAAVCVAVGTLQCGDRSGLDVLGLGARAVVGGGASPGGPGATPLTDGGPAGTGPNDASVGADASADTAVGGDSGTDAPSGTDGCAGPRCRRPLSITVGYRHACALMSDTTVECWGQNTYGQIGSPNGVVCVDAACDPFTPGGPAQWYAADGGSPPTYPPTTVPGLKGVTALSAGSFHTCAVLSDSTIQCWGDNFYGQLGDGTTNATSVPTLVTGLTGATSVSATMRHTCALIAGGMITCWGDGQYGELGSATTTTCGIGMDECSPTPVGVPGVAGATAIAAGNDFSAALLADGTVTWWGYGPAFSVFTPEALSGLTGVSAVVTGLGGQGCATLPDGSGDCWGSDAAGELGRRLSPSNPWGSTSTPAPVPGLTGVRAMAVGQSFTCALVDGGTVDCWGYNQDGELGRAENGQVTAQPGPPLTGVTAIAAGEDRACALLADGTVQCWGSGTSTPVVVPL